MAARITLRLGPTNQTKPIIINTVSKLATRLLTTRSSTVEQIPAKIEIFMPESAIMCNVPVFVSASIKSVDNVALVRNNMPANKPA
jgi:hypothetical protein